MSHELRHPLQIILGICDTLLKIKMDKNRRDQFIQDIESEARRMTKLAENLKSVTDHKSSPAIQDFKPINLLDMVDQVIRLLSQDAQKKGLLLKREGTPDKNTVLGDPDSLIQVLINLVVNAIQYTDQGEVCVILKQEGERIKITVADTGSPVSESHTPLLGRYIEWH